MDGLTDLEFMLGHREARKSSPDSRGQVVARDQPKPRVWRNRDRLRRKHITIRMRHSERGSAGRPAPCVLTGCRWITSYWDRDLLVQQTLAGVAGRIGSGR